MVSPIYWRVVERIQGKINIFKVDTESEQELAAALASAVILPSFLPQRRQTQMAMGALPQISIKDAIDNLLLGANKTSLLRLTLQAASAAFFILSTLLPHPTTSTERIPMYFRLRTSHPSAGGLC
jgi:hypothetical protein